MEGCGIWDVGGPVQCSCLNTGQKKSLHYPMLFNSYPFLFIFLPIVLVGFYFLHRKSRRAALAWVTASSLVFYGYWDYHYLGLVAVSIVINCALGYQIARDRSKAWLIVGVLVNLAAIAWFKYSLFLYLSLTGGARPPEFMRDIILPLGISFFTFQQISYLVKVWRGHETPSRLETHAFIVLFFPHLIAGPIVLYENIAWQVRHRPRVKGYLAASFQVGLFIFAIGLFKKVVIADSLAPHVNAIFKFASRPDYDLPTWDAWIGASAYSLQLYFDFSGYSDMAIGLGRMFGFRLPMNFNSPYKALNIIDFWRRWHITLSSFFRNYVYIPLGGNRKGVRAQLGFVMVVFFLTGLWHGAGWTFILWGTLHGSLVALHHIWTRTKVAYALVNLNCRLILVIFRIASQLLTLMAVVILWVIFRADSWVTTKKIVHSMFSWPAFPGFAIPDHNIYFVLKPAVLFLFICCITLPNSLEIVRWVRKLRRPETGRRRTRSVSEWIMGLLYSGLTGTCLYLAVSSLGLVKSQFLYFNF